MSVASTPRGYSLFDLFTRIIPGSVVLIPIVLSIQLSDINLDFEPSMLLIILGLGALIIGEFVNLIRATYFRVPAPFKSILYQHTENESVLSREDKIDLWIENRLPSILRSRFATEGSGRRTIFDGTDMDFQNTFEDQFGLSFEEDTPSALYLALLSYMDSRMSTSTRRYYILQISAQNAILATLITGVLSILYAVQNFGKTSAILVAIGSIILLVFVFEVALVFSSASYPFIDSLVIDYYVNRQESQN